jgi:hypothetical protein
VWDGNDGDPAKFWLYSLQTENYIKSYDWSHKCPVNNTSLIVFGLLLCTNDECVVCWLLSTLLLILDLGTDGGEWSASRPGRALAQGKGPPVPIVQEAGWAPEPVWAQRLDEKSFRLCRESNLDCPVVYPVTRHSSNGTMNCKWWIEKDVRGCGRVLSRAFSRMMRESTSQDSRAQIEAWTWDIPTTKQKR